MAVAFDAGNSAYSSGFPGPSSITTSFTVGAGANFIMGQVAWAGPSGRTVSGITYAGAALTQVTSAALIVSASLGEQGIDQWYRVSPSTGANNMVSTLTSTTYNLIHGFESASGVDTSTPLGTASTGTGTSTSASTGNLSGTADDLFMGLVCVDRTSVASDPASDNTQAWEALDAFGIDIAGNGSYRAGTGSAALTWTLSLSALWNASGVPVKASGGGGGGAVGPLIGGMLTKSHLTGGRLAL